MKVLPVVILFLIVGCREVSAWSDAPGSPPENDASQKPDESVILSAAAIKLPDLNWTVSNPDLSLASQRMFTAPIESNSGFKWKAATVDSFRFLMLQNVVRIAFQAKTRRGLRGPFFKDYTHTLGTPPSGFTDGDSWVTNYYLHPVQGSASYHLARVNGASRTQAFYWGIAYSTQFELGPVGEGTIGNVPISPVDLVVTPSVGYALGLTEEWLATKIDKINHPAGRIVRLLLLGRLLARVTSGK